MPRLLVHNLRASDPLPQLGEVLVSTLASCTDLRIDPSAIDFIPVLAPVGVDAAVTRIDIDLWIASHRTNAHLQDAATRLAEAFQALVGRDRRVKVVLKPYDVGAAGWVEL